MPSPTRTTRSTAREVAQQTPTGTAEAAVAPPASVTTSAPRASRTAAPPPVPRPDLASTTLPFDHQVRGPALCNPGQPGCGQRVQGLSGLARGWGGLGCRPSGGAGIQTYPAGDSITTSAGYARFPWRCCVRLRKLGMRPSTPRTSATNSPSPALPGMPWGDFGQRAHEAVQWLRRLSHPRGYGGVHHDYHGNCSAGGGRGGKCTVDCGDGRRSHTWDGGTTQRHD